MCKQDDLHIVQVNTTDVLDLTVTDPALGAIITIGQYIRTMIKVIPMTILSHITSIIIRIDLNLHTKWIYGTQNGINIVNI